MTNYITGDTHGKFDRVEYLCQDLNTTIKDTLIILGDVGINYYGKNKDIKKKEQLSKLPITLFCVKGNHENYAPNVKGYELIDYLGGKAYVERRYPNLIFAKDGEIYNFEIEHDAHKETRKAIVIGGAYSVDKYYRLMNKHMWFDDEQPSEETKAYVEHQLDRVNWDVDYVFSHTCPERFIPREWFLPMIDQSTVDNSTEQWLDTIYERINVDKWYCGHFHGEKLIDNVRFLFRSIFEIR